MRKNNALSQILIVGSGGLSAQFITVLSTFVVTRLYSPEHYAAWAILIATVAIIGGNCTLRYETAIVLPSDSRHAAQLFLLSSLLSLGSAGLLAMGFFLCGGFIDNHLGTSGIGSLRYLLCLLVACTGITASCQGWFTRVREFWVVALSAGLLAAFTLIAQFTAAMIGTNNANGLIVGTIIGQTASTFILVCILVYRHPYAVFGNFSWRDLRATAWNYRNYPRYITPYSVIQDLTTRSALYLMTIFSPGAAVGYFAFASRLSSFPVTLLGGAIRPVLYQKASVSRTAELQEYVLSLMRLIIKVGTPLWIFFIFNASLLMKIGFGSAWEPASRFAVVLSISASIQLLSGWMDRLFDVRGKQRLAFQLQFFFSCASIAALVVGHWLFKDVFGAICLQVAVLTIQFLSCLYIAFRISDFQTSTLTKCATEFIKIAAIMSTVAVAISGFSLPYRCFIYLCASVIYATRNVQLELNYLRATA